MSDSPPFLPFGPSRPASAGSDAFRLKVLSPPADSRDFASVAQLLRRGARPDAAGPAEPAVSLRREGDRVTGIRIQCTCGQVIELACEYGP